MSVLKKFPVNNLIIFLTAALVMFLPRLLYIAGVYSYRAIIILCVVSALLINIKNIHIDYNIARIPFYIFYCIALLRFISTGNVVSGLGFVIDTVVLFSLIILIVRTRKDFELFVNVFVVVMAIYSLLGILECLSGFNIWYVVTPYEFSYQRYGLYRSNGSCINYMNNGALLMLSLPIIAWKIQQKDSQKRFAILAYILVLINILATLTRTAILCVFILQIIWLIKLGAFRVINKHILKILAGVVICIFVMQIPAVSSLVNSFINMFLAIFDDSVASEISSSFGGNAEGTGQRLLLYEWIWDSISDNKWFGVGPGKGFSYRWVTSYGTVMTKTSIENEYLSILYRFGLVGLGSYVIMIISYFINLFKLNRQEVAMLKDSSIKLSFTFMVITAIGIYYISGFFYSFFEDNKLMYILMALACCYVRIMKTQCSQKESEHCENNKTLRSLSYV